MGDDLPVLGWLRALGAAMGTPITLDEHGVCALTDADGREFVLELPAGSPVLQLYTPLRSLRGLHADTRTQLLERCLELNAPHGPDSGAKLGLDPAQDRVLLSRALLVGTLDSEGFLATLASFAGTAAELASRLDEQPALVEGRAALAPFALLRG